MSVDNFRSDEKSTKTGKIATLLRLYKYMFRYKVKILLVLLIMGVCIAITLINPLIIKRAIDYHIRLHDTKGLLQLGIFAATINIILVLLIKTRMFIMAKITNEILLEIRQELYTHIQKLSFSFFDSRPTGKILSRIIGDVNSLKDVLSNSVTTLIPDFLTICSVVVLMMVFNYKLALASLISVPFMGVSIYCIQRISHLRWGVFRKKSANVNAFIHEDFSGIRQIQSLTAEDETAETFNELLLEHRDSFVKAVRLNDLNGPIIDLSWGIASASMFFYGIKILGIQQDSIGLLIAFGTYISMFWSPMMNLSNFYNQLITNIAGAERIFEILDTPPDIKDNEKVCELPEIKGDVRFSHVSFSYGDQKDSTNNVLNDVSFHINPGETIALVGPTGAGKSTIVNLLSRFYDIKEGAIYIDNYNIKEVSIESLRKQMGVMTQDNFIFTGTIKENIQYGRLDATDEEIINAAKAVNAHEFITKLEKGYDTVLEERGNGLSIGQKQLLAFARTMVSNPKILILDEATSSIDTKTELLVQRGIENLLKGRTSFVIAHRLSTIQKADQIFVINDGGISEQGTAKQLLEKKGDYYNLYMAQFKSL